MTEQIHVRPGEGRRVRHPVTMEPIGAEGAVLARDSYVVRRLADGDLVEVTPAARAATQTPPAPTTETKRTGK